MLHFMHFYNFYALYEYMSDAPVDKRGSLPPLLLLHSVWLWRAFLLA